MIFKNDLFKTVLLIFIGLIFISLSIEANGPHYGIWGAWSFILGGSIVTATLSYIHGKQEAKRLIPKKRKFIRLLYRSAYFALISLMIYRQISVYSVVFFMNQAFLFGAIFDPVRNYFADEDFYYHGVNSNYDLMSRLAPKVFFVLEIALFLATAAYLMIKL